MSSDEFWRGHCASRRARSPGAEGLLATIAIRLRSDSGSWHDPQRSLALSTRQRRVFCRVDPRKILNQLVVFDGAFGQHEQIERISGPFHRFLDYEIILEQLEFLG